MINQKKLINDQFPESRGLTTLSGFDSCLVGMGSMGGQSAMVYLADGIIEELMERGMDVEEAAEYLEKNIIPANHNIIFIVTPTIELTSAEMAELDGSAQEVVKVDSMANTPLCGEACADCNCGEGLAPQSDTAEETENVAGPAAGDGETHPLDLSERPAVEHEAGETGLALMEDVPGADGSESDDTMASGDASEDSGDGGAAVGTDSGKKSGKGKAK